MLRSNSHFMRYAISKLIKTHFSREHKGVAAVEFALVIFPFLLLVLFTMELCRVIFLYAAIDLSISEASQRSSYSGNLNAGGAGRDYASLFRAAFQANTQKMPLLFKDEDVGISVKYCDNIDDVISDSCSSLSADVKPLAIYSVVYHYKPLFFIFSGDIMKNSLARNIVYVQEYER
jgi:tight adherence protein E